MTSMNRAQFRGKLHEFVDGIRRNNPGLDDALVAQELAFVSMDLDSGEYDGR